MRMDKIIRKGADKEALRAIELLWTSLGRLPQKGAPAPEINAFNQQELVQPLIKDRADAKAAMALLLEEKRRQQKERDAKVISLDPSQVE